MLPVLRADLGSQGPECKTHIGLIVIPYLRNPIGSLNSWGVGQGKEEQALELLSSGNPFLIKDPSFFLCI
jgi:hypothetical protein